MSEERLDDASHGDHTSDNSIESGIVRQETSSILLFGHSDRSELIFEIHTRRSTAEEGRTVKQLLVFGHTILVVLADSSIERHGLDRNQLKEVGHVVHFYTSFLHNTPTSILILRIIIQCILNTVSTSKGEGVNHMRAIEACQVI